MARHQELSERARDLVEEWPPGGLVAGLLPDPSDPEWAERAALALALAAADRRGPALILDLAPEATDLAARFGAEGGEPGIAELVDGEAELWEIVHRHASGDAFYLPCGLRTPGAELARSPAVASLADRVRSAGRIALVPLDRRGAGEAASTGWVDGFVRLGERGVSSARLSGDARTLGHLERRGGEGGAATDGDGHGADAGGAGEPETGRETGRESVFLRGPDGPGREGALRGRQSRSPVRGGGGARLKLRRRRRFGDALRKAGRAVAAAALLLAGGVTASAWLGGPGWHDVGDAARTAVGRVGDAVPAGAGGAAPPADSASGAGSDLGAPPAGDSAAPSPADTAERGG